MAPTSPRCIHSASRGRASPVYDDYDMGDDDKGDDEDDDEVDDEDDDEDEDDGEDEDDDEDKDDDEDEDDDDKLKIMITILYLSSSCSGPLQSRPDQPLSLSQAHQFHLRFHSRQDDYLDYH